MLIATKNTVYCADDPSNEAPRAVLDDEWIITVAESGRHRFAGTRSKLISLGGEAPSCVAEVPHGIECLLILDDAALHILVGTHEAHLYEWSEGAGGTRPIVPFDELECRNIWRTPWGGPPSVRSLAATRDGATIYADIHVGSIMYSTDGGAAWAPVTPELDDDVHEVATCAAADQRVYANTANAVYVSDDRGQSWIDRGEGLGHRYGRAIAVHGAEADCILATVSDGPHGGHGQLYHSDDAGRTWTHVIDGFPQNTPDNIDTHHVAFDADGTAWVAVDRTLYMSRDRGSRWTTAWAAPTAIRAISVG